MSTSTSPSASAPRAWEPNTSTAVTRPACGPPAQIVSSRADSAAVAFPRAMRRPPAIDARRIPQLVPTRLLARNMQ
jgi:hypothetical protein